MYVISFVSLHVLVSSSLRLELELEPEPSACRNSIPLEQNLPHVSSSFKVPKRCSGDATIVPQLIHIHSLIEACELNTEKEPTSIKVWEPYPSECGKDM